MIVFGSHRTRETIDFLEDNAVEVDSYLAFLETDSRLVEVASAQTIRKNTICKTKMRAIALNTMIVT